MNSYLCNLLFLFFLCGQILKAQSLLTIKVHAGINEMVVFPPIDNFANSLYPETKIFNNDDIVYIEIPQGFNGILAMIVNHVDINVYVGDKDTIEIELDSLSNEIAFEGDNAYFHEKYNKLKDSNREYLQKLFAYTYLADIDSLNYHECLGKVEKEITSFDEMMDNEMRMCQANVYYKTSIITSMLFWIKRNSPIDYKWEAIADKIIDRYIIDLEVIKGTLNNSAFYEVYYSLKEPNENSEIKLNPFVKKRKYLMNAPYEIVNFLVQSQFVGHFRFVDGRMGLCELYDDIKPLIGKYYYPYYFEELNPCD